MMPGQPGCYLAYHTKQNCSDNLVLKRQQSKIVIENIHGAYYLCFGSCWSPFNFIVETTTYYQHVKERFPLLRAVLSSLPGWCSHIGSSAASNQSS